MTESSILGKWYAIIYMTKKSNTLFIGKVLQRFLNQKDGQVELDEFRCFKPKVGTGTVSKDTPDHLPGTGVFKIEDIIYGPVQVLALRGNKLDVLNYASIVHHFQAVSTLDRTKITGTL